MVRPLLLALLVLGVVLVSFPLARASELPASEAPPLPDGGSAANVSFVGSLALPDGIHGDVWVHRDFVYVGTWREPDCPAAGVKIVDAADPAAPADLQIAAELDCDRHTVGQWRKRFLAQGLAGLQDAPRSGRPRSFPPRRAAGSRHAGHPHDHRA